MRQVLCDWCQKPIAGKADSLSIELLYASADRSEIGWSEEHNRYFCSRRCLHAWLKMFADDVPGEIS